MLCSDSIIYVSIANKVPANMVDLWTAGINHGMGDVAVTGSKISLTSTMWPSHMLLDMRKSCSHVQTISFQIKMIYCLLERDNNIITYYNIKIYYFNQRYSGQT